MRPFVAVLDYGIGNLRSAQKALIKQGALAELTSDPAVIRKADGVVLPGVGHFGTCMTALKNTGLDIVVRSLAEARKPFLAICVGMQMLYESSTEAPGISGLGIIEGEVRLLTNKVLLPQIQWSQIKSTKPHFLLEGLDGEWMYFVHSYIPPMDDFCTATACYGEEFPAVVFRDSISATQFHPEKSGAAGLKLIGNFIGSL